MKAQKIITALILIMIVISVSTDGTKAQKTFQNRYIKHELKYVSHFIGERPNFRRTQFRTIKNDVQNDNNEESSIHLESWMLHPESWKNNISDMESTDEDITLKDWMLDADKMYNSIATSCESDPVISLEDWMLAPSKMMGEISTDALIELSGWMMDPKGFKK